MSSRRLFSLFSLCQILAHLNPSAVGTMGISSKLRSAAMDGAGDVTVVHVDMISSKSWCSLLPSMVLFFFSVAEENIVTGIYFQTGVWTEKLFLSDFIVSWLRQRISVCLCRMHVCHRHLACMLGINTTFSPFTLKCCWCYIFNETENPSEVRGISGVPMNDFFFLSTVSTIICRFKLFFGQL